MPRDYEQARGRRGYDDTAPPDDFEGGPRSRRRDGGPLSRDTAPARGRRGYEDTGPRGYDGADPRGSDPRGYDEADTRVFEGGPRSRRREAPASPPDAAPGARGYDTGPGPRRRRGYDDADPRGYDASQGSGRLEALPGPREAAPDRRDAAPARRRHGYDDTDPRGYDASSPAKAEPDGSFPDAYDPAPRPGAAADVSRQERRRAGQPQGREPKARSRQGRGRQAPGDDQAWPRTDWDNVSDEQYWAELSSDKPLTTTARTAQPGASLQADPEEDPADSASHTRAGSRRARSSAGGIGASPPLASTETPRLPVRRRDQLPPASAQVPDDLRAGDETSLMRLPHTEVPVPTAAGQDGADQYTDPGLTALGKRGSTPRNESRPPSLPDDDPLTSASFSRQALSAPDSRSYRDSYSRTQVPPDPYEAPADTSAYAAPGADPYGTAGGEGYGGSVSYGGSDSYAAQESYGATDGYGTPGSYAAPDGYPAPGGYPPDGYASRDSYATSGTDMYAAPTGDAHSADGYGSGAYPSTGYPGGYGSAAGAEDRGTDRRPAYPTDPYALRDDPPPSPGDVLGGGRVPAAPRQPSGNPYGSNYPGNGYGSAQAAPGASGGGYSGYDVGSVPDYNASGPPDQAAGADSRASAFGWQEGHSGYPAERGTGDPADSHTAADGSASPYPGASGYPDAADDPAKRRGYPGYDLDHGYGDSSGQDRGGRY